MATTPKPRPHPRGPETITLALVANGFQTPTVTVDAPGTVLVTMPLGATTTVDVQKGDELFLVRRCASPTDVATLVVSRDGTMWRASSVDAVSFDVTVANPVHLTTKPALLDSALFFDVLDVGKH